MANSHRVADPESAREAEARRRFVTRHGIIRTGVPLGVIITVGIYVQRGELTLENVVSANFLVPLVVTTSVMGLCGRFVYAPLMWSLFGRTQYRMRGSNDGEI